MPCKDRVWTSTFLLVLRKGGEVGMIQIDVQMPSNCYDCWIRKNLGCRIANDNGWLNNKRSDDCPLKAQEPRVMTLEEVKALPSETDVWLDEFCSIVVAATISCTMYGNAYFYGIEHAEYGLDYKLIDYGKEWRCWTSRPTYKQKKMTPWQ